MKRGYFISFEGIDGAGKSAQIELAVQYIKSLGYDVVHVHEPGGTEWSESMRALIKSNTLKRVARANLLAFQSTRADVVESVIIPSLNNGKVVVCDRFADSTRAYQGYGEGLDLNIINQVINVATQGLEPDLTLLFDISLEQQNLTENAYFEAMGSEFFLRVSSGFRELAERYSERIRIVNRIPGETAEDSIRNTFEQGTKLFIDKLFSINS